MIEKKQRSEKLIKVPYIDQTKEWPTGCESVSTVMFLQYLGVDISMEQFAGQYLEKTPLVEKNGMLYGGDPWKVFVGDPADSLSMGCYAPVIKEALEKVMQAEKTKCSSPKKQTNIGQRNADCQEMAACRNTEYLADWAAVDLTGVSMEVLLREYIDNDIPVIFWASIDLKETYEGPEWILPDTGETFVWRSNEHCMLLVGYDEKYYYFNDPWHNHGTIGYEKRLVEQRHAEQYQMAVSVKRKRL